MAAKLARRHRTGLALQRALGRVVAPLLLIATVAWMRYRRGYSIRDLAAVRRRAAGLLGRAGGPLLVCPNHLTWIDSLLVQWALVSPWRLLLSYRLLAWNLPERNNFYTSPWLRTYCYLTKCIPIERGGDRDRQRVVIDKVAHLLARGEPVMIFPEGGRGRGRIDVEDFSYGSGRIVKSVENCRVLCVYMRGDRQPAPTVLPRRRQCFSVDLTLLEPRTQARGLRATRELAGSIVATLAEMEERHFAAGQ